jgi:hypothetical protein
MDTADFDLEHVLRLARQRCTSSPPCFDCVAEATTDLILEQELGPGWREVLVERPVDEDFPV